MYGHQQSNTRKLVKHWQSGGGSSVKWLKGIKFTFAPTFQGGTEYRAPTLIFNTYIGSAYRATTGRCVNGPQYLDSNNKVFNATYLQKLTINATDAGSDTSLLKAGKRLVITATLTDISAGSLVCWAPWSVRSGVNFLAGNTQYNNVYTSTTSVVNPDTWVSNNTYVTRTLSKYNTTVGTENVYNSPTTQGLFVYSEGAPYTNPDTGELSNPYYAGFVYYPLKVGNTITIYMENPDDELSDNAQSYLTAGSSGLLGNMLANSIYGFYNVNRSATYQSAGYLDYDTVQAVDALNPDGDATVATIDFSISHI